MYIFIYICKTLIPFSMKRFILFASLMLASMVSHAQRDLLKEVSVTINSETGIYAKGDTVRICAALTGETGGEYAMTVIDGGGRYTRPDGTKPQAQALSLSSEPRQIYCGAFDEPKHIILNITRKGVPGSYMVGFLVAADEFRPGYEIPSDFDSYWDAQKKALRKSNMKVTRTSVSLEGEKDAEGYLAWDLEISMPEGPSARGYLVLPENAAKKSLPIYMYLHSAGVNKPFNKSTLSKALSDAKAGSGCISLDLNAHGMLNGQPQSYYDGLYEGDLKNYSTRPLTTRDEFYFRQMYLRELRALDYLCSLREWDGKRVLIYGESQGGGQVLALAGLDPRVGAVVANVPAMTDYGATVQERQCGWPSSYGKVSQTELGKSILPYCDGALFAQRTKAKMFFVAGGIDETCDPACVHAAFNACPSEDKQIHDSPFRWHSGTNKPYDKVWNTTIGKARNEFIEEYLK